MFNQNIIVDNYNDGVLTIKDNDNDNKILFYESSNDFFINNSNILEKSVYNKLLSYLQKNHKNNVYINLYYKDNKYPIFLIEEYSNIFRITENLNTFKKIEVNTYKCSCCDKIATWCYDPLIYNEDDTTITPKLSYFCETHVEKYLDTTIDYKTYENKKERINEVKELLKDKDDSKLYVTLRIKKELDKDDINVKEVFSKQILSFIKNNDDDLLMKYEIILSHPGYEYSYSKNGFIIYINEDYTFSPELE